MKKMTGKFLPLFRAEAGTLAVPKPKYVRPITAESERERGAGTRLSYQLWAAAGIGVLLFVHWELATAAFESRFFSALASKLHYSVEPGRSPSIAFPKHGPFDERRGYSRLPEFTARLEDRGFRYGTQARFTPALAIATRFGVEPPYREPAVAGLIIHGAGGAPLYEAMGSRRTFSRLEEVPPDIVKCLLFIENRELDQNKSPYANPAIDWSRTAKAILLYFASHVGLPMPVEGGSTLAVQIEKYRHSPEGRTTSAVEKLRQLVAASLRVYQDGPETTEQRRRIVVDYLNTVPLGGVAGYGEVFGFDEGLRMWFGSEPEHVYRALAGARTTKAKARALKQVLALICAVRAPTRYLTTDRDALEERIDRYAKLMGSRGVLEPKLADAVAKAPLRFAAPSAGRYQNDLDKGTILVRKRLMNLLAVRDLYELDRLHIEVETTLDAELQREVTDFLRKMNDPEYVDANGLRAERLLAEGDPRNVIYSLVLRERTPQGDVVRVQADNLRGPFDVNEGMKMELGSTAKLRTLVHYLSVMAMLHEELAALPAGAVEARIGTARDPLTKWAAETLRQQPGMGLEPFLDQSLERKYSATPYETFYTGGGFMTFQNYDPDDNGKIMSLREGAVHSTNLVFVRLMRDLVQYHQARLPYDADHILGPSESRARTQMLREVAREEGTPEQMAWLFRTKNRQAQDLRLRTRIERDAFARMTPYWRQLGFPFSRLVPSYATAIGSSSDQPAALADLMGVILNDGVRRPPSLIKKISFAGGTPYETSFEAPVSQGGDLLIPPEVARATRSVLGDVVDRGTAQRLRGVFTDSTGAPVWLGGKTGTGDNRYESFGRGRQLISSRAVSRTAAFAFCLSDRYYGVITSSVVGPQADHYGFTSSLPLAALRLMAPTLEHRLHLVGGATGTTPQVESEADAQDLASIEGTPPTASTPASALTPAAPLTPLTSSTKERASEGRAGEDVAPSVRTTKNDADEDRAKNLKAERERAPSPPEVAPMRHSAAGRL